MISSIDSNNSKICKIRIDSKYANICKIGIHIIMLMRKTGIPYSETQSVKSKILEVNLKENESLPPNLSTNPG
ncbi:MAG: hypothetical protein K9H49_11055 [Bacteroidales bacterium]|nr:hypothetical protein [Bacteroidales bacterium]MCF8405368.1 hypothetical protein [Bacteroidales bacterium]